MSAYLKKSINGYTLAETLIAVIVVGIIAVFIVPKVIQSVTDQQYQAKFKQTLDILDKVQAQGATTGDLTPGTFTTYFFQNLNTTKQCSNGEGNGCVASADNGYIEMNEPAVILQNGVSITGLNACCSTPDLPHMYYNGIVIDVNGLQAPNAIGQDQVMVVFCYGPQNCLGDRASTSGSACNPQQDANCDPHDSILGTPYNNTASNPFSTGSFVPSDSSGVLGGAMANTCKANVALYNKLLNANYVSKTCP